MSNVSPTKMSRADAIKKLGTNYPQMEVAKGNGFAGSTTVTHQGLGEGVKNYPENMLSLPAELSLPLETDIGETVYILRLAHYKNGNVKRGKGQEAKWEQVTDEVTGVKHVDAVPAHMQEKGYPYSHKIIWETQTGATFQTPLVNPTLSPMLRDEAPAYNTQFVFTSPEDMQAFIERVAAAENGVWANMSQDFVDANIVPANDPAPAPAQLREATHG